MNSVIETRLAQALGIIGEEGTSLLLHVEPMEIEEVEEDEDERRLVVLHVLSEWFRSLLSLLKSGFNI